MSCVFRASGKNCDVEGFLQRTTFRPVHTWRRGEIEGKSRNQTSGFNVDVSVAGFDNFARQVSDAIGFLKRHSAEIVRMRRRRGLEEVVLHFGVYWRSELAAQYEEFSPALVELAGKYKVAIALSHYKR